MRPAREGEAGTQSPNREAICNWYLRGKGKPVISSEASLGTVQGRP